MAETGTGIKMSGAESSNLALAANGIVTRAIVWRVGPCRMTNNAAEGYGPYVHHMSGLSPGVSFSEGDILK